MSVAEYIAALIDSPIIEVLPGTGTFAPPTNSNDATTTAATTSTTSFVSSIETFTSEGLELIALRNPHLLSAAARERVFELTIPYTALAFSSAHLKNDDLSTMSAEDRQDHLDHTFGGDGIIFLLAKTMTTDASVDGSNDGGSSQSPPPPPSSPLRLCAHLNASFVTLNLPAEQEQGPVIYIHGVCCDPSLQGCGLVKKIFTATVRSLRPKARYLTLRTMNVAVVKLMGMACAAADGTPAPVYPVDTFDPASRPDVVAVAEGLSTLLGWTGLQSDRLVIPKGYPSFLIPVFRGALRGGVLEEKVDRLIDRDAGDALCCVTDL